MDDLITFVRARLDEREKAAQAMQRVYPTPWDIPDRGWMARVTADGPNFLEVVRIEQDQAPEDAYLADVIEHVWRNAPDYALDDIESKRRIVELYAEHSEYDDPGTSYEHATGRICGLGEAVRLLAIPFAAHPDYREEWRP